MMVSTPGTSHSPGLFRGLPGALCLRGPSLCLVLRRCALTGFREPAHEENALALPSLPILQHLFKHSRKKCLTEAKPLVLQKRKVDA